MSLEQAKICIECMEDHYVYCDSEEVDGDILCMAVDHLSVAEDAEGGNLHAWRDGDMGRGLV